MDCELLLQVFHVNGAYELERDADVFGTFDSATDAVNYATEHCDRWYGIDRFVLRTIPQRNPNGSIAMIAIATPIETQTETERS